MNLKNLKNLKMEDLKDICRNNNIKGFSNINKESLISLIKKNKKMIGGHVWVVPNTMSETHSWLYIPIIYKALGENIIFPVSFSIFLKKFIHNNSHKNILKNIKIPNNLNVVNEDFFEYVRTILQDKHINNINDLKPHINSPYNIPRNMQEEYLYQNEFMENILGYLVENLIATSPGEKIEIVSPQKQDKGPNYGTTNLYTSILLANESVSSEIKHDITINEYIKQNRASQDIARSGQCIDKKTGIMKYWGVIFDGHGKNYVPDLLSNMSHEQLSDFIAGDNPAVTLATYINNTLLGNEFVQNNNSYALLLKSKKNRYSLFHTRKMCDIFRSGATMCLVECFPDHLTITNVGDSQAVVFIDDEPVFQSIPYDSLKIK